MEVLTIDGDGAVMWQICLHIQGQEVVDFLLAPELGGDLSGGDGLLLVGAAVNECRHLDIK